MFGVVFLGLFYGSEGAKTSVFGVVFLGFFYGSEGAKTSVFGVGFPRVFLRFRGGKNIGVWGGFPRVFLRFRGGNNIGVWGGFPRFLHQHQRMEDQGCGLGTAALQGAKYPPDRNPPKSLKKYKLPSPPFKKRESAKIAIFEYFLHLFCNFSLFERRGGWSGKGNFAFFQ